MNADQLLFQAVSEGRIAEMRALVLTDGANVAAQDDGKGSTPLHWSACNGHYPVTRALLELGAPVNARNNKGETPLHLASMMDKVKVACLLMDHGADIFAKDSEGRTPVSRSVMATDRVATMLLKHKKDQDRWAAENETLIAVVGSKNIVKMQKLLHDQNQHFHARLQEQQMQLLQRQEEAFHSMQATISLELQGRMSILEQQQQQHQNASHTLDNNDVSSSSIKHHHHDNGMLPMEDQTSRPPKKRQKGLCWNENNNSNSNNNNNEQLHRVTYCEEQLEVQRVEMAALRQIVLKMTACSSGMTPLLSAAVTNMAAAAGAAENTKILITSTANKKAKMEHQQTPPQEETTTTTFIMQAEKSLGPDISNIASGRRDAGDSDNEDSHQQQLLLVTANMELELERVRLELQKSQAEAQKYKMQRDEYKMERDHYKNKMEQLHRLTCCDNNNNNDI